MHTATFSFTDEYNRLNAAQKKAVETTEGPVLVIAGPGTGKTQILAARIGNILDKGLAFAENILCLTYTDAGVNAMRKRLIKFIGPEAYKVNIHTFHSFCNKIIQEHPEVFSLGEMQALSSLEEIELFEKLIDGFGPKHPLKRWRGDIYYEITRIKNLFGFMKNENVSFEQLKTAAQAYLDDLPNKEEFIYKRKSGDNKKGDLKVKEFNEEVKKMAETVAAAGEYEKYEAMKAAAYKYDYNDMLMFVLKAFQENEYLLSRYQEQFQYFLVDEYQDTNGTQNEILRLLYTFWEAPNVFVVGDDDQSIFRFQGANLENIIQFYQESLANLPMAEQKERIIVLKENYRSTQEILDLAAASIQNNQERLVNQIQALALDKSLHAAGDIAKNNQVLPKLRVYPNPSHEVADIANQIIALKNQGVPLYEIAVLYPQHKLADELQQCFNQYDIAFSSKREVNILHESLSGMLLTLLQYIHDESKIAHSREDLLFKLMHFPFFSIKAIQIARLSFELRESRYTQPKTTWREALLNLTVIHDAASVEKMELLGDLCNKWQHDLHEKPVQLLFQTLIEDIHCLEYIQNHKEKVWLLQELKTLFDFIKDENQKNPSMTLSEFLEIVNQYEKYKISIPILKSNYAEDAVQLNTLHGAKGLEFQYVFMMACSSNYWDKKNAQGKNYKIPEGLQLKIEKESAVEEMRRLFFVGLTRAKKHLQISYCEKDKAGKDQTASLFVTEIVEQPSLAKDEKVLSDAEIFAFNILQLMPEKINAELLEENMLRKRLESYKMSVTHLNNYLHCPLKFYYHNFIQIPQAKNASLAFGSAVHNAIENLFKEMKANNDVFPSVEVFLDIAKKQLYREQDSFTKKEYQQKQDYLEKFLPAYYEAYVKEWNTNVYFEKKLEAVYKGISLTGKIDKIEFSGNRIIMIDYKTGMFNYDKIKMFKAPNDNPKNPDKLSHEDEHGGDYWRQAVFYKILLNNNINAYQRDWQLERTEFDFVEPDPKTGTFHKEKVLISPQDENIVEQQIVNTWAKIQNLDFQGCGKSDCSWCAGELEKQEENI